MDKNERILIDTILPKYINQIIADKEEDIAFNEAASSLLVIAEAYSILKDKYDIDELLLKNMNVIKKSILENKLYGNSSIFDGLSEGCLSVYAVYKSTGKFERFLDKINKLLCDWTRGFLEYIDIKENLKVEYYDSILGISGICSCFLLINDKSQYDDIIKEILAKLIYISMYTDCNGSLMPNWYIKNENLRMERDRGYYPNGNINFGLSHGIAGPLVVLSEAYSRGIIVEGQLIAIENIVNEFKKLAYRIDDTTYWTGLLKPEYYLGNGIINDMEQSREGWCYGAIGIAKALLRAGACIDDDTYIWALNIINEKAKMNSDKYMLDSPTICHGYSGVLSILVSTKKEKNSIDIEGGISKLEDKLIKSFDESTRYGFIDIEIKNNNGERVSVETDKNTVIDGSAGVILSLLSSYSYGNDFFMKKLLI